MSNKSTPEPSDNLKTDASDPNNLPLVEETTDSNKARTGDKPKASGGTGTIRVNG